jgi:site-specific DNA-methyltransferase (adenine-specific)
MFYIQHTSNSFEFLKSLPDDSVDVTITDPPYNAHVHNNLRSGSLVGNGGIPKYELTFDPISNFDFVKDLVRVTRRWVVVFCALEDLGRMSDALPESYIRGCVWGKKNSMGQLTGDRPATAFEGIALFHKPKPAVKKRWNGRGSYGIWSCAGTRGKKGRHPNEKPVALASKLIALFSERGETVFDPFCGSAAIGEAAISLDRNYAGLDFDPEWVGKANERLSTFSGQLSDEVALGLCKMWAKEIDEMILAE